MPLMMTALEFSMIGLAQSTPVKLEDREVNERMRLRVKVMALQTLNVAYFVSYLGGGDLHQHGTSN